MRTRPLLVLSLSACALLAAAPAANAAVTVGEANINAPWGIIKNCPVGECNYAQWQDQDGDLVTSPIDGVVVRWRIRFGEPGTLAARVFRPVSGENRLRVMATGPDLVGPAGTDEESPALEQAVRLPVRAGDLIGARSVATNVAGLLGAGRNFFLQFTLAEGDIGNFGDSGGERMFINADVEPDGDGDGFGDETQDGCPTNATAQGACPAAPSDPAPPTLGTLKSARSGKSLGVQINCPAGRTACTGRVSMRSAKALRVAKGVKEILHFRERSFNVPSGESRNLALKLAKADQRLLKRLRKIRAVVLLQPSDAPASRKSGTLRAPRRR